LGVLKNKITMKTTMNFDNVYIKDVKVDLTIDVEATMENGRITIYDADYESAVLEGFRYGNEEEYFTDEQLCNLVLEFITSDWDYFIGRLNKIKREEGCYYV
jgi:hypothetical protein